MLAGGVASTGRIVWQWAVMACRDTVGYCGRADRCRADIGQLGCAAHLVVLNQSQQVGLCRLLAKQCIQMGIRWLLLFVAGSKHANLLLPRCCPQLVIVGVMALTGF